jgi:hypothetical protein
MKPKQLLKLFINADHASHAAFAECGTIGLAGFGVHAVHHLDGVLELLALDLVLKLRRKSEKNQNVFRKTN